MNRVAKRDSSVLDAGHPAADGGFVRRKLKLSDLPLTSAQRSAIDSLLHTFKKKGEFDVIRKRVYSQFEEGVCAVTNLFGCCDVTLDSHSI